MKQTQAHPNPLWPAARQKRQRKRKIQLGWQSYFKGFVLFVSVGNLRLCGGRDDHSTMHLYTSWPVTAAQNVQQIYLITARGDFPQRITSSRQKHLPTTLKEWERGKAASNTCISRCVTLIDSQHKAINWPWLCVFLSSVNNGAAAEECLVSRSQRFSQISEGINYLLISSCSESASSGFAHCQLNKPC